MYNPILVWIFVTAWIWGIGGAIALAVWTLKSKLALFAARLGAVVLGFAGLQSLFWIAWAFVKTYMLYSSEPFGATFHWLFSTNLSALVWWVAAVIGVALGLVSVYKKVMIRETDTDAVSEGLMFSGLVNVGLVAAFWAIYWLISALNFVVQSITAFG